MVSLTFYGGVKEIGGNKILLEDKGTKIFLDFGMNFNEHSKYFTEYMPPRKSSCISDLMSLGLLPNVKGIYRRDYCKHMGIDDQVENGIDGVLITHAHMDHVGYIHFLRKDIPIYVSPETKAIMDMFTETGAGGFSEFSEVKPSFEMIPLKTKEGVRRRTSRDGTEKREIRVFEFGKPFKVGSLEVTAYRVDHSLPGATAFVINTSKGNLVYTGDLRFHGRHSQWSHDFVDAAANFEPEFMITEGTRITQKEARTEEYVQTESGKVIKDKKGLVIANFPIRDSERLLTFYNTAVENNRKLIIEVRQAIMLDLLSKYGANGLPTSDDKNIMIFYPKKSWGLVGREGFTNEQVQQDYSTWEKSYLGCKNVITAEEIAKNQDKYVMFMNYFQLNNLLDIKPKNAVHIRSICEPFNESMELDQERIDNWLKLFKMYPEHKIHSSGHASGPAIFDMIETIKPKSLFPIHTELPGKFRHLSMKVKMVKQGTVYNL
ncbi:MAG: MBL fold metallo-hydrolase [Nanoarchaeota archaeon]|nr:MBL fold metallo-hydrolase [Nanoarchaeota archaeon]